MNATATLTDTVSARISLDRFDLIELVDTGMLRFRLGDQDFELRTGSRPDDRPYSIRVSGDALESLRAGGEVAFRRLWGRLTVVMTEDVR